MRRQRAIVFRAAAVLIGLAAAALMAEAACRVVERGRGAAPAVPRWTFRASRPAPYRDADYFGPDFLHESLTHLRLARPPGAGYVVPVDVEGRWVSVRGGRRVTTDQPAAADRRVLLFGGSTVMCNEVPDRETVASHLQRALAARGGGWRVENLGVSSMTAGQQAARLRDEPLRPGDVVVFYDGVNDVYYPVYNGNPRGWLPGDGHDGGPRTASVVERWLAPLSLRAVSFSAAARAVQRRFDHRPPAGLAPGAALDDRLAACEDGYRRALADAAATAARAGARFVHALQPTVFTLARPSGYERWVRANELKQLPGLDEAFAAAYPRLRRAADAAGVGSVDLSALLDDRPAGAEVYLDFCHVTHAANARAGAALAARVAGEGVR